MKPSVHRYVLPPVLLGVHLLLLLPLVLAPPAQDDARRPDDLAGPPDRAPEHERLLARLHPMQSGPLALLGFVGVHVLKQMAGAVPLPRDPRRLRLAARIEWSVLFALGVVEELWRWAIVRLLIWLLGGKCGFRGRGQLWDLASTGRLVAVRRGSALAVNTKYPSIWEAVYAMGWTWSLVETAVCSALPVCRRRACR